jgi:hypothetical protein
MMNLQLLPEKGTAEAYDTDDQMPRQVTRATDTALVNKDV